MDSRPYLYSRSFDIIAVDSKKGIEGIIKINGISQPETRKIYVVGICMEFSANLKKRTFKLNKDEIFFYGIEEDFKQNYPDYISKEINLEDYIDKDKLSKFYKIPIGGYLNLRNDLELRTNNKKLIEIIFEEVIDTFADKLEKINTIEIGLDQKKTSWNWKRNFAHFPPYLEYIAKETKIFYRYYRKKAYTTKKPSISEIEFDLEETNSSFSSFWPGKLKKE